MNLYGSVFFNTTAAPDNGSGETSSKHIQYVPLSPVVVQDNLRDRAALREFKQVFPIILSQQAQSIILNYSVYVLNLMLT